MLESWRQNQRSQPTGPSFGCVMFAEPGASVVLGETVGES
jgi:hypothetical protein